LSSPIGKKDIATTSVPAPNLFEESVNYQEYLDKGIKLSGEGQEFFIQGRLEALAHRITLKPGRILDFGCGNGLTTRFLRRSYPNAEIIGIDPAVDAIEYARANFAGPGIAFYPMDQLAALGRFDLSHVNGVFHHIPLQERLGAAQSVWKALEDGGLFAFFENNPWNPGTRLVMKRIPFDRDAITLSIPESKRLLRQAGFSRVDESWTMFYFPRILSVLRPLEPSLGALPLGAQYCVLARK
jgi:SAM-dependent methyltransferase